MALTDRIKALFARPMRAQREAENWPFVPGRYYLADPTAPVIVVMPENDTLADTLSALSVRGLCMVSASCRSVSDVVNLIRNVEANLAVRSIILAGADNDRSYPAVEALSAIFDDDQGISEKARRIAHDARGKLKAFDFAALQKRVEVVNMLHCADVDKIVAGIIKHGSEGQRPDAGFIVQGHDTTLGIPRVIAPTGMAHEYHADKAGTFVIGTDKKSIVVEHYNSRGELLRLVQGASARDLSILLIRNGWVSRLDHAAYLGRELTLAEIALREGVPYEWKPTAPGTDGNTEPDRK